MHGVTFLDLPANQALSFPVLYSREIAVGSFLFIFTRDTVNQKNKALVYLCCNASQQYKYNLAKNNMFWYQIEGDKHDISPN